MSRMNTEQISKESAPEGVRSREAISLIAELRTPAYDFRAYKCQVGSG